MSAPAVAAGFFGKLPARGDFVRAGLPGGFVAAWDTWLQAALPDSRARLGEQWLAAWLEAPVWRFLLHAGQCGPDAVLGLWMPSVDAVGRHFPLTIAAVFTGGPATHDAAWLDAAEECGRRALEADLEPAALAACLPVPAPGGADGVAGWWTDGAPLVLPGRRPGGLPGPAGFAAMLMEPAA